MPSKKGSDDAKPDPEDDDDVGVNIDLDLTRYPAAFGDLAIRSWVIGDETGYDWTAASFNTGEAQYRKNFIWPILPDGRPARGVLVEGPSAIPREIMLAERPAYEADVEKLTPAEVKLLFAAAVKETRKAIREPKKTGEQPGPNPQPDSFYDPMAPVWDRTHAKRNEDRAAKIEQDHPDWAGFMVFPGGRIKPGLRAALARFKAKRAAAKRSRKASPKG